MAREEQVIVFAQLLAANETKVRDKALKNVGLWFERVSVSKDAFNEDKMLKLWKALFYYFWHCDKPLVQEAKADVISKYIHNFKSVEFSFLYIDTCFQTMGREWLAIDKYRLEKFMMLVRRFLNQSYELLKQLNWDREWIEHFCRVISKTGAHPTDAGTPLGFKLHVADIYMEELAKVGNNELSSDTMTEFLAPYLDILTDSDEPSLLRTVSRDVFLYLINQEVDEEEYHQFPTLQFDAGAVQSLLLKHANKPGVRRKNIKVIHNIVRQFEDHKSGLSMEDKLFSDKRPARKLRRRAVEAAALTLMEEEVENAIETEEFKRKRLKKR